MRRSGTREWTLRHSGRVAARLSCLEDTLGRRGSHVGRGGPDREAARPRPRDRDRTRDGSPHPARRRDHTRRGRSSHDFVVKKELQPPRPACTHAHRQTWTRPYINVTLSTSRRHRPFDTSLLAVFGDWSLFKRGRSISFCPSMRMHMLTTHHNTGKTTASNRKSAGGSRWRQTRAPRSSAAGARTSHPQAASGPRAAPKCRGAGC